jgi:hypothetical protein
MTIASLRTYSQKYIVKWRGIGSGGGAEWWACNGTGSIAINLGGYEDAISISTASSENSPMNIHQYRKGCRPRTSLDAIIIQLRLVIGALLFLSKYYIPKPPAAPILVLNDERHHDAHALSFSRNASISPMECSQKFSKAFLSSCIYTLNLSFMQIDAMVDGGRGRWSVVATWKKHATWNKMRRQHRLPAMNSREFLVELRRIRSNLLLSFPAIS